MNRQMRQERNRRIVKAVRGGRPIREVADEHLLTPEAVRLICRRAGLQPVRVAWRPATSAK